MTQPNILLLHCHDLGRFLSAYGIDSVQSPALDSLAREGVVFERAFAAVFPRALVAVHRRLSAADRGARPHP